MTVMPQDPRDADPPTLSDLELRALEDAGAHPMHVRSIRGRRDAVRRPSWGRGPVVVYSPRDTNAAAVAFWRALGLVGHMNRHNRSLERRLAAEARRL